ncbi:NAD dependent epimerase/dehydratase family protein [Cladophialophora carrionii]|uniref:NAD dependent epimerase/dehydratase family protein n=1 Tax=Cladophialophora carrionii TaxID=86049 RepID=A0A1C1CTE0_9EURO|nr:NAD dependent epimerase/dehydratase family protein [Cladophialophora carrionii]
MFSGAPEGGSQARAVLETGGFFKRYMRTLTIWTLLRMSTGVSSSQTEHLYRSSTHLMALQTQTVCSQGIFHGLPTYPETADFTDLTAIVTGANGITGYSMVKVLAAAPKRWSKIYCLSRKPPPAYFYDELGEGASARVVHVSVDFLSDPATIAASMKAKIPRVDHVFFFSYMQPKQEGDVLSMWSNAQELADLNGENSLSFPARERVIPQADEKRVILSLAAANLTPKRFLLQTGAKHYGFHIGPATCPSFETDPHVQTEPNFYYVQEDMLAEHCRKFGCAWNVVRPSYVIGAVRESALNHLVGMSVYASVQAYRGLPLAFPGDVAAWDREHCQSTGLLNSYMEEWAVLSPHTANEAFNMQDGNPFTYGRLWPYLADWYGTGWTPPSEDESAYKVVESRAEKPPRGYGPRGQTRYTFSLLEWSHDPAVQQAWTELQRQHGLDFDPFASRDTVFGQTDSAVIGGWPLSLSMRKARRMGWLGSVDSYEAAFHALRDMARLKVLVPLARDEWCEVVA